MVPTAHMCVYNGAPLRDEGYVYVDRKGFHSLNVQVICDANYHITNVVARWPVSTHDIAGLQASIIGDRFEARGFV